MKKDDFEAIKSLHKEGEGTIPAHSFENHILGVYENAKELVDGEDVDRGVVEFGALLHDIGRFYPGDTSHAEKGAKVTEEFLARKLEKGKEFTGKVSECVRFHSYRPDLEPPHREAELVWIADKMDALGTKGLFRYLLSLGAKGFSCSEAIDLLERRAEDAEKRMTEFGFEDMVSELQPFKNAIEQYEEENNASD